MFEVWTITYHGDTQTYTWTCVQRADNTDFKTESKESFKTFSEALENARQCGYEHAAYQVLNFSEK